MVAPESHRKQLQRRCRKAATKQIMSGRERERETHSEEVATLQIREHEDHPIAHFLDRNVRHEAAHDRPRLRLSEVDPLDVQLICARSFLI
jgi:hypothetical protein